MKRSDRVRWENMDWLRDKIIYFNHSEDNKDKDLKNVEPRIRYKRFLIFCHDHLKIWWSPDAHEDLDMWEKRMWEKCRINTCIKFSSYNGHIAWGSCNEFHLNGYELTSYKEFKKMMLKK